MHDLNYDWKKAAAQAATPDADIEQAFFSQAVTFIQNKAAPLMKDPYRLGFEIVQKNDDNTKLVGIFAFRIGKDLYYAPCFFLNGDIKGTDLFYRCTPKRFVPLTEDWVKLLLERDDPSVGKGVDRGERKKYPADLQLRRISLPPFSQTSGVKFASTRADGKPRIALWLAEGLDLSTDELQKQASEKEPGLDTFLTQDWEQFIKDATTIEPLQPILKRFILEDGGQDAIDKIAYAIEHSPVFTERLLAHSSFEDFMPELPVSKKASTSDLVLFTKTLPAELAGHADEFFKRGHFFLDKRAAENTAIVYDVVDDEKSLESVGDPGYYNILLDDGSEVEAFCARKTNEQVGSSECTDGPDPSGSLYPADYAPAQQEMGNHFVTKDGRTGWSRTLLGHAIPNPDEFLKDSMEVGSSYRIFDGLHGTLSDVIKVKEKNTTGGITIYKVENYYGGKHTIKHNPEYKHVELADGVVGEPTKFAKVAVKEREPYGEGQPRPQGFEVEHIKAGDEETLRDWILGSGIAKKAKLIHNSGDFALSTGHLNTGGWTDRLSLLVGLTRGMFMKAAAAEELADKAVATGEVEFFIEFPKSAGTIRLLQHPDFQTQHDSDFGTEVEYPQGYAVPTLTENDMPPEHRIGDAWDPGMGQGPVSSEGEGGVPMDVLLNSSPAQLAQLSQQDNLPHMFEHGAVGMLTNTYDSASMIDKYLPDMEQGLDRAGRIIFLFYWKPNDYQNLYGVDDMDNLENKLLSNFKSWGDLVLDLLKKSKLHQKGTPPMPSH